MQLSTMATVKRNEFSPPWSLDRFFLVTPKLPLEIETHLDFLALDDLSHIGFRPFGAVIHNGIVRTDTNSM